MDNLEILAPAGSFDSLEAAVNNGADAVYLGLNKFSARAKAENFNLENLKKAIDYCHVFNCKVYITVNTLLKDNEIEEATLLIKSAHNLGADAFIVQDLGLISKITSTMPNIVLHGSTQMGIHNLEGALIAEKLGLKRVVLSRETLIEDIKKIRANSSIELEFFVQGALCVSFSGNCYFSSLVSGYSGNRGKCLQLCRKKYSLNNSNDHLYHLSTKDLCLANRMKELVESGITSFKIEGRMRRAEYVGESVRVYKKALSQSISSLDINNLKQLYNRGDYCEAHLNGTCQTIYNKLQNHSGLKVGTVKKVLNGEAFFNSTLNLNKGDGIKFLRKGFETGSALISKDNTISTGFAGNVLPSDDVYITTNSKLNSEILLRKRYLNIDIKGEFFLNKPPKIQVKYNDITIEYFNNKPIELSINAPTSLQDIKENMGKCGGTFFKVKNIEICCDDNIFVPKSEINLLRRNALSSLEEKILSNYELSKSKKNSTMSDIVLNKELKYVDFDKNSIFITISNLEILKKDFLDADFIIFNPSIYSLDECVKFKKITGKKAVLQLPIILRGNDIEIIKRIIAESEIEKYIINNLSHIELTKNKEIIFGYGMNLLNSALSVPKIQSIESDRIDDNIKTIIYAHGKAPLMTFTHCPRGNECKNCSGDSLTLKDEKGFTFTIRKYKINYCYHQMINNIPIDLPEECNKLKNASILLDLSQYSFTEAVEIFSSFKNKTSIKINRTKGNIKKELK